jgi:hypothetical protein
LMQIGQSYNRCGFHSKEYLLPISTNTPKNEGISDPL